MQQMALKDFMKRLFSCDLCFRGWAGGLWSFSPGSAVFGPTEAHVDGSERHPWSTGWAGHSFRCSHRQMWHLCLSTDPQEKAQEMKEEKFTSKTYSIPFQGPAGCIWSSFTQAREVPPGKHSTWCLWDWGPFGEGVWWTEEKEASFYPTESPFSEYSYKSVTPRARTWGLHSCSHDNLNGTVPNWICSNKT